MRLVTAFAFLLLTPVALAQPSLDSPGEPAVALSAPSPNPTDGRAVFVVSTPTAGMVTVDAFDLLGRKVATLFSDALPARDRHPVAFDGSSLPDGLYVIVARNGISRVQRLVTLAR